VLNFVDIDFACKREHKRKKMFSSKQKFSHMQKTFLYKFALKILWPVTPIQPVIPPVIFFFLNISKTMMLKFFDFFQLFI